MGLTDVVFLIEVGGVVAAVQNGRFVLVMPIRSNEPLQLRFLDRTSAVVEERLIRVDLPLRTIN